MLPLDDGVAVDRVRGLHHRSAIAEETTVTTVTSPSRAALAHALTNDQHGVVSAADAKAIVAASVTEIARANDPQRAFVRSQQTVNAALALVAPTGKAQEALKEFGIVGQNAVVVRLGELARAGSLPTDVKRALNVLLVDAGVIAPGAAFHTNAVKGDANKGFSFEFSADAVTGKAHALRYGGSWVLSPTPLTKKHLDDATAAMRAWFDAEFAPDLAAADATPAEIAQARAKLLPRYAFFPGASDPNDLVTTYPVVLSFDNQTGSDHGLYLGLDPATGDHEAYAFN